MNEGTWFRPSVSHRVRSCRAAFVLVACGVLAGCSTQLRTVRVKDADTIPTAGVPYNLTFTQYEITVARRLAGVRERHDQGQRVAAASLAADGLTSAPTCAHAPVSTSRWRGKPLTLRRRWRHPCWPAVPGGWCAPPARPPRTSCRRPWHHAVIHFGRAHMDADHVGDLATPIFTSRPGHAGAATVAQAGHELLAQLTPRLRVDDRTADVRPAEDAGQRRRNLSDGFGE